MYFTNSIIPPSYLCVYSFDFFVVLSIKEIELQVKTLAERARDAKITVDEMRLMKAKEDARKRWANVERLYLPTKIWVYLFMVGRGTFGT